MRATLSSAKAKDGPVLFVCRGNICRSPFAERLAMTIFPSSLTIQSAGYLPPYGRSCPPEAVEAAFSFGVDLSPHRSRPLTYSLLNSAAAVFVFDFDNEVFVSNMEGNRPHLPILLGALSSDQGRGMEIADPFGHGIDGFTRTYKLISESLYAAKDLLCI